MTLKNLLLIGATLVASLTMSARDQVSHDPSVLPQAAQQLISKHFPSQKINHIKIDKNMFGVEGYDVVLSDGTEIDLDSKGNLKDVDCGRQGQVPDAIVAKPIREYVATKYPKQRIIKYDVKRSGYEVELQSGIELEFNSQGQFLRVDH